MDFFHVYIVQWAWLPVVTAETPTYVASPAVILDTVKDSHHELLYIRKYINLNYYDPHSAVSSAYIDIGLPFNAKRQVYC